MNENYTNEYVYVVQMDGVNQIACKTRELAEWWVEIEKEGRQRHGIDAPNVVHIERLALVQS